MTVFFHGNFGLNRPIMSKLLELALENPEWCDKELAAPFDYKVPFASKYRAWLNKTGIIEQGFPVTFTEGGKTIFDDDPNFEKLSTMQFMHEQLISDPREVETWYFFIHEFLPNNPNFTRQDLEKALMMKLRSHSEKHFGPKSKMNTIIARKLIECYTEESALKSLELVTCRYNKCYSIIN
jgi:hypothetical protein